MDIHRCRFVPYPASPINAVAFSHTSSLTTKRSATQGLVRLAVGRANGDIEIWNPAGGSWFQETIIQGGKDRSIDGLVWVTAEDEELPDGKIFHGRSRLFSIGYTTTITEWDLEKGSAKRHASGQHGDIWCLGVQPLPPKDKRQNGVAAGPPQTQKLVAGTVDGSLVLYSIDDDDLRLQRVLVKTSSKKVKMVSMAFQSRNVVIVGCSDSSIRAYDMRNGNLIRKMTLGSDLAGGSKEIIVWSVKCLPNGDIVSGDSTGQVCIWDGKTYTQAQRLQSHNQDVLSLATSADGSTIVSGGMDRRTVVYRPMARGATRWTKVFHRRYHNHDVKTMASFEDGKFSVIVSGGPDATPVVMPLRRAGMENHRTLSHLPQSVPLASAPRTRLIVSWWEREVHIWRLKRPIRDLLDVDDLEAEMEKNRKLVARILVTGSSNISSASISHDGSLLVVSTVADVKAFRLSLGDSHKDEPHISKVTVPSSIAGLGASKVQVSPDGNWVCLIQEGSTVVVAKAVQDESTGKTQVTIHPRPIRLSRLRRNIPKYVLLGGLGGYERTITHVAFSSDSKVLATADLAGYVDTWILRDTTNGLPNGTTLEDEGDASSSSDDSSEDEESEQVAPGPSWIRNPKASLIPKLPATPAALSFSADVPGGGVLTKGAGVEDYVLLAITTTSRILTFHPLHGSLTNWSRRNFRSIPEDIRTTRDIAKGVVWQGPRIWIYGASFLSMVDLSADIPGDEASATPGKQQKGIKRKRGPDTGAGNKMETGAIGPHVVRVAEGGSGKGEWVDVDMADAEEAGHESSADLDDEDDETDGGELQMMRGGRSDEAQAARQQRKKWWHTYKYRPILGIVPLEVPHSGEASGESSGVPPVEVALVERPIWDVDLPPRYLGDDEFER
ncbi:U3 small nucleolar RNA-associated protein 4 [Pleurostoma richardsiae]|uniref:U3 small nucleolar RNA-associated protein 4 n=1 Tax=Pleurostoma richardsiae TaxID=41990 RepID=A0AA38R457_9PEZI|nr:U3 small nucleolar RNA-associated protein 4 [Pleurostoma richardsiae]